MFPEHGSPIFIRSRDRVEDNSQFWQLACTKLPLNTRVDHLVTRASKEEPRAPARDENGHWMPVMGIFVVWEGALSTFRYLLMFKRISGHPKLEYWPKAASTAMTYGALSKADGSGHAVNANATSGDHLGIIMRKVVSTDGDYASATVKIPIDFLSPEDIVEADVSGTLTAAMVGNAYDLTSAGDTVNVAAQAKKVVTCVGFISATKGLFKVNAMVTTEGVAST